MKKIASIILAFVFVIGVCASAPITANAASVDDLTFEINEEGTMYQVKDCNERASGDLVIPSTYNGLPVTIIGAYAFWNCESLTSVTIPDSVTIIVERAFYRCPSLTSVTIPDSVTSIGDYAFYNCESLTSVTIPDSVTSIGYYTFYGCTSLTNVTIPDSVTSIGNGAFGGCTSLTNVTIPDSVTSIGDSAFEGCTSLTNVTIPDSVTSIGSFAFDGCTSLTNVTIGDSVTSIGSYAFGGCTSLTNVTIPDSVTSIGGSAFYGCESLTNVTIGDSVTSIGYQAFCNCTSLTSVNITNLASWCNISFDDFADNPLYYAGNLYLKEKLVTDLVIPDGVTNIVYGAFNGCTSLTSVTIPDSVTSIGDMAFFGCTSLTGVTIPDSVTSIGYMAFSGCTSLASVTIPDSVTSIGYKAFSGCTSLTSVIIPDSVTFIPERAFFGCMSLTSVTIPHSVTNIGYGAFYGCTSLTSVTIPDNVTFIEDEAFGYKYDSWEEKEEKIPGFTIYGAKNSEAERYATANGFTFIETEAAKPHKHTYTSSVTKQPSYTETGIKKFTCSCGDSYTEVIPKLEKFKAPTIVSITSEKNGVKFTWNKVSGVEGYIVYKLVDGEYQQVAVQAPSNTVYVDKKAVSGNTYSYAVASMNRIGNPGELNEFSYKYEVPAVTSLATPVVKTSNTAAGIKVTWNAIENAENYTVYRRVYNESTKKYSGWTTIKTGYTGTNFTDTNVKFGVIYSYTVRAVSGDVRSSFKAATGTRVNVTPTVKVANASNGVKVTWNAVPNATGYTVYSASYNAKTKKWSGWTNRGTVKSGTTSWTDKKTKSGTYYKYTVRACYGTFKSSYKASDKIWYLAQPSVTVKAASNGVNVNWTQSSGSASYIIYRQEYNAKTKTWSGWKNMGSLSKDKKSWTDKSAKKGVYYKYTVRAVNGNYKSTYKASANVKR